LYHFANIYDPNVLPLSKTVVYIGNINTQGSLQLTVKYASLAVPKNFHVIVEPRIVANGTQLTPTSSFVLRGDSEAIRTRTADNTHSTFLDLHLTQTLTFSNWVIDSFFIFTGDAAPLFSNFDIQTFVSTPSSTLSLSSTSHDFVDVVLGSPASFGFKLSNNSASNVTITDVSISPAGTDFTVPTPVTPFLLKAGKSTFVTAGFAPTSQGPQSATVTLAMDDGTTLQIALSGNGVASGVADPGTPSEKALTVVPNPASTVIHFAGLSKAEQQSVDLLDLLGRTVLSQKLDGSGTFNVSRLEPGRYEAVVHTAGGMVTEPVIIAR
ncbi:MAG: T9SS type A sorting domain-containing protein, partial [Candidatus Kapaibacterium sp.]